MQRFRHFFAALFIASIFLGALHEVIHDHHHEIGHSYEESCPLYLLNHTAALNEAVPLSFCAAYTDSPLGVQNTPACAQRYPSAHPRAPPVC